MKKIRLGMLGLGNQGTMYSKKILADECPEFTLAAICDHNPKRIDWAKENLGTEIAYFDNAEAMLESGVIDACIVAVPHYDHPKYAVACMERGIHVLVEKPAGVYTKQVRWMNEEARKHNVVFGMMFNQRTNWLITNWYRPQAYYDSGDWRATWSGEGGGVLMNQCPHQLDLLQWICGMPVKVTAHMKYGQWHDIEVEDDVTAYLEYENGATGVFITTTGDAWGSNRFEVQMDKAKLVAENDVLTVTEYAVSEPEFTRTNVKPFGRPEKVEFQPETDGKNPQHVGIISAWGGAILRGEPLFAPGEDGINGLTLANAMYLSDWLGKTVDIPFDEDVYYEELMKRVATSRRKVVKEAVVEDMSASFIERK